MSVGNERISIERGRLAGFRSGERARLACYASPARTKGASPLRTLLESLRFPNSVFPRFSFDRALSSRLSSLSKNGD